MPRIVLPSSPEWHVLHRTERLHARLSGMLCASGLVLLAATARAEDVTLANLDRVVIGEQPVMLAGVTPGACAKEAASRLSPTLAHHAGRFFPFPDSGTGAGIVVLDDGRNLNELALQT